MANTVNIFCDTCNDDRDFVRTLHTQTLAVRGESITAKIPMLVCPVCKNIQPDPDPNADPMVPFYEEYRRRHGLLTPREITETRKRYGMSPETFAKALGMSPATIYRYEGGALQDEVHDTLLRLCQQPQNMSAIIQKKGTVISALQRKRFQLALSKFRSSRGSKFKRKSLGTSTRVKPAARN